jgi:hypothetical protein
LRTFRLSTGGNGAKFAIERVEIDEIDAICANFSFGQGVMIKMRIIYRFSFSSLSSIFSIGGENACKHLRIFIIFSERELFVVAAAAATNL